jgi:hypothetical protein
MTSKGWLGEKKKTSSLCSVLVPTQIQSSRMNKQGSISQTYSNLRIVRASKHQHVILPLTINHQLACYICQGHTDTENNGITKPHGLPNDAAIQSAWIVVFSFSSNLSLSRFSQSPSLACQAAAVRL